MHLPKSIVPSLVLASLLVAALSALALIAAGLAPFPSHSEAAPSTVASASALSLNNGGGEDPNPPDYPAPLPPDVGEQPTRPARPAAPTPAAGSAAPNTLNLEPNCLGHAITINGTDDDDDIEGTPGDDVIHGQGGDDYIFGSGGNDIICGDDGDDVIYGESGNDTMDGGAGWDHLYGDDGNDVVNGGDGGDNLYGGAGDDTIDGGAGWDWLYYYWTSGGVDVNLATGTASGDGNDTLSGIEAVMGSDYDDVLTAGPSGNVLGGNDGDDTLVGGSGVDEAGYWFAPAAVTADLVSGTAAGEGDDTLTGIENLNGSYNHGDSLTGDDGNNSLRGWGGDDTLSGAGGDDSLYGDAGDDTLDGGAGNDYLYGGEDNDRCLNGETLVSCEPVGSISGTVQDSEGDPIEGAWVFASPSDIPISPPMPPGDATSAYSGADGSYTLGVVVEGQYVVGVYANGYVDEYYNDVRNPNDATLVTVTEGEDTNIDFDLDSGGRISGVVTSFGGLPLEQALITASPSGPLVYTNAMSPPEPPELGAEEWAYTDEDGAYVISGLLTSDYIVKAQATDYLDEYFEGARMADDATLVSVTEDEETSDVDFVMDRGGTISGVVRNAGGSPLRNVWVYADPVDWQDGSSSGYAYSGLNGSYTITGLAADNYIIEAEAEDYVTEYYDSARSWSDATPVSVAENQDVSGIDFALDLGGTISGIVRDDQGEPIEDCDLDAESWDGDGSWGNGYTDEDGFYTITGLATGDYRVNAECHNYVVEYYANVRHWNDATLVHVTEGHDVLNINFSLNIGGRISGTVTDSDGDSLEDCDVWAEPTQAYATGEFGPTDEYGSYAISGLATGSYVVEVWCDGFIFEYYDDTRDWDDATPVSVTEGDETEGIDFSLNAEGTISGTVLDVDDEPLTDARVCAVGNDIESCDWTDDYGAYFIDELVAGEYLVYAGQWGYITEYYPNVRSEDEAAPVSVTEGENTPDIDFNLDLGGTISVHITDDEGNPLEDGWALASPSLLAFTNSASPPMIPNGGADCQADEDGDCTIVGLATGDYIVNAGAIDHPVSYFNGATSQANADPVAVTEGESTSVTIALDPLDCGDSNEDRRIGMSDAMRIAQCVAHLIDCSTISPWASDVSGDGRASMLDAMRIAQFVARLIQDFNCTPSSQPPP